MLTHGLLPEEKLEKVRRELGLSGAAIPAATPPTPPTPAAAPTDAPHPAPADEELRHPPVAPAPPAAPQVAPQPAAPAAEFERRIAVLEAEVAALRTRLDSLEQALGG
jgi:hypothetical protein